MIKNLHLFIFAVAASSLISSCMKDGSYKVPGETYVVSDFSIAGGTYFKDDLGNTIVAKNSQEVDTWAVPSGRRLYMVYNQDQDSWNEATRTWRVDVVALYDVPVVEILPADVDTLGTDPFYYDANNYLAWTANGFLTARFAYQYSGSNAGAAKHTFGLAGDPEYGDYSGGDTVRLLLWHNAHGDALQAATINHTCVRLNGGFYSWIARDSAVIAVRYKTSESASGTMYAKYKRN